VLHWSGPDIGPVVQLNGPTQATVRELAIDAAHGADGIVVDHADQPGGRVYLQGAQIRGGRLADVYVDHLDDSAVFMEDFGQSQSPGVPAAVLVRGGPRLAAGGPGGAHTSIYSGASSHDVAAYDVSEGGVLLLRDFWYEAPDGPRVVNAHGRASVTIDGARLALPVSATAAAIEAADLNGALTVVGLNLEDRVLASGDGVHASVLALGLLCGQPVPACVRNSALPAAQMAVVTARRFTSLPGNHSTAGADAGSASPQFMMAMLRQARADRPAPLSALPAGITDVRLFRVQISNGRYGLRVRP
jgi:hypothetical protein